MKGLVYKSTGSWYTVKAENDSFYECRIKGKFRIQGIKSTNPIAVGDWVDFEVEDNESQLQGVIHQIYDRKNYIIRKSVNLSKQTHIIAANIDCVFLMITLNNPPTHPAFIDRFLVAAEAFGIPVVLLFNKEDVYSKEERTQVQELKAVYEKIGYECIEISALLGHNVERVQAKMKAKVSIFSGHSGVGKSTLVNTIAPFLAIKTASISTQHSQGQHTTTFAQMYDLDFDAKIIDTPGIKGFGVVEMEKSEIGNYFPEFFKRKSECKFNNCLHKEEPNCAVKKALDEGKIALSRYKSYCSLVEGEEEHYRTDFWTE
jgi:ribosome biogenesis GTPase